MLDTSVIYPFLWAVTFVAVVGVTTAAGLLINESRSDRRRTRAAREVEPPHAAQGHARGVITDHKPRS